LPSQCATAVLSSTVTVAGELYAPGHLGELTQYVPFELVDDVLEQTRTRQARLRMLPSRVGMYFTLALALFPALGYARVWDKLTAGLRGLCPRSPSEKSLRDLRRRLGAAPLELLFETLAARTCETPASCPGQADQTGSAGGCQGWARPTSRSQDNPNGVGRIGGQAGTQASDPTPVSGQNHVGTPGSGEAGRRHYPHPPCRLFAALC
jgi:hypothetical protein